MQRAGGSSGAPRGRQRAVLTGISTSTHRHGRRLLFAPDGTLFVSAEDAEVPSGAQDRNSLAGKVLRIRRDGRAAPGNPFGNRTWSCGHRDVEGLAFDAEERLWATEFGGSSADELNLITRGRNDGWPIVEGRSRGDRCAAPPRADLSGDHGRIRRVAVAPDGLLWVTTSNTDGRA
ncbi:MAG TPA: PQQ-dependent sugar dehydrogenase [Microlunatus sp.]|nr:PQQ-dependent sugar dehydrogenase [Microlunatus sp.]